MRRQLEEKIKAAQADYKALYEDLRTLNHSLNENGRAMLQLCNELLDIRQKMKAPGITEDEKAELEELARQKIYTLHADQPEAQV